MRVERFAGPAAEWDAFAAARGGSHCHRHAWRTVIQRSYGHDCPYLCARGPAGELIGVLPLVSVRSRLLGRFLVSMPYMSGGGPLGPPEAVAALTERAAALAREGGALLELRGDPPAHAELSPVREKVRCELPLVGGAEKVWARFPGKLRNQVGRCTRAGAEVRFGRDQVDAFNGVFARTMRDLGTPPHPLRFFREVADSLGDDAWFGCVYLGGRPVAAGCAVRHGPGVELMWAGALRIPEAPNMLLHAAFIRRAAEEGLERFDFGRCTPGAGTHRFKLQWGAVDIPLTWARSSRAERMPRQDRGVFAAAAWMWRRLPVPITVMVGSRVRGGLPA